MVRCWVIHYCTYRLHVILHVILHVQEHVSLIWTNRNWSLYRIYNGVLLCWTVVLLSFESCQLVLSTSMQKQYHLHWVHVLLMSVHVLKFSETWFGVHFHRNSHFWKNIIFTMAAKRILVQLREKINDQIDAALREIEQLEGEDNLQEDVPTVKTKAQKKRKGRQQCMICGARDTFAILQRHIFYKHASNKQKRTVTDSGASKGSVGAKFMQLFPEYQKQSKYSLILWFVLICKYIFI